MGKKLKKLKQTVAQLQQDASNTAHELADMLSGSHKELGERIFSAVNSINEFQKAVNAGRGIDRTAVDEMNERMKKAIENGRKREERLNNVVKALNELLALANIPTIE